MSNKVEKSERDLLVQLIHSNMSLARAFAAVAHLRYDQGNDEAGEYARGKALKFYSETRRLVVQLAEEDRQSDSEELEKLSDTIMSLSTHLGDSHERPSAPEEQAGGRSFHKFWQRLKLHGK